MSPVVVNLVPFLSPPKRLHLFSCVARTPFHKYTEQTLHLVSDKGPHSRDMWSKQQREVLLVGRKRVVFVESRSGVVCASGGLFA